MNNEYIHYQSTIEEDENGDLILTIPPQILDAMGWKEGDSLDISLTENGGICLKKE
jgi:AbrB family looped-hinge helix DNA binding protein